MSKVLVIGDGIEDVYRHFTATRLCPEGPVPVLTETKPKYSTPGGAGLVAEQLKALGRDVTFIPMSHSVKERIFADDRLMLRIDHDSQTWAAEPTTALDFSEFAAIIYSDYGKGDIGRDHIDSAIRSKVPVFVDAKKNWETYVGAFAAFPNQHERAPKSFFKHVIQKLGSRGCEVNGVLIPTSPHEARDVTGAGDVFLAAFVYQFLEFEDLPNHEYVLTAKLESSALFANKVAGISVRHTGTYVVSKEEAEA